MSKREDFHFYLIGTCHPHLASVPFTRALLSASFAAVLHGHLISQAYDHDTINSMATTTSFQLPSSSGSSSDNRRNDEELFDKFATLFTPATPRASPIPGASPLPSATFARPGSGNNSSHASSMLPVANTEDPLAILSPSPTRASSNGIPARSTLTGTKLSPNNPTLSYFERFGQDAKAAVDQKRNSTLEELLAHQDDPLYWIEREDPEPPTQSTPTVNSIPDLLDLTSDVQTSSDSQPEFAPVVSTHTFDEDYFSPRSVVSSVRTSPDFRHSPKRSTSVLIPTPAPPVESKSPVASGYESPPSRTSLDSTTSSTSSSARQSPYATLTNFSSKFMSSILPSAGNLPHAPFTPFSRPSLDTLFGSNEQSPPSLHRSRSSEHASSPIQRRPAHASSSTDLHITHGTPFGPSSKPSPFAAHVYIPPTGAPGYGGEKYDWDKGFSTDLEQEVTTAKVLPGDSSNSKRDSRASGGSGSGGVVKVIDKKAGGVELLQRRESTDPVLDTDLAELIRAHLPALARLPRKWNLAYSLDQHGISLNTLYTRCEAATQPARPGAPTPAGSLLIVKDSDGGIFGAWTGKEGIHLSKGGYYGSGDSFLWRYIGDSLQIFSWTGKNDYVALCEPEYISFGGGDGNYGLYLDDTLFEGSSAYCPTFANEPLCSPGPKKAGVVAFECVGLEVWTVGP